MSIKYSNFFLYFTLFLFLCLNLEAQSNLKENLYVNPMITLGYSIGSGFTYGLDFTFGFTQIELNSKPVNIAISTKIYFINLNGYANRAVSINLIAENEYIRLGGGFSDIKRKWGYKNRNVYKTFGPATDFGIHFGNNYVPWIGLKTIFPLINKDWYERPNSISIYTYFRQNNIVIFKSEN